jgi:hypothetical protein
MMQSLNVVGFTRACTLENPAALIPWRVIPEPVLRMRLVIADQY